LTKKRNLKVWIGVGIILATLVYLLVSSTLSQARYFYTVEEIHSQSAELLGKKIRLSGVVLGDTIVFDPQAMELRFDVAQIPADHKLIQQMGGMNKVLAEAASDPDRSRVEIVYHGARPDLLKHEAQAIMTGELGEDLRFYATELLLKCPSKYESILPEQSE
jgi:cytochrome c-type biogenesis protein CcmE